MMRRLANVSAYPVTTHWTLGSVVWNSRKIVGIATLSTELSSTTISAALITITSVNQRLGSSSSASLAAASSADPLAAGSRGPESGAGGGEPTIDHDATHPYWAANGPGQAPLLPSSAS